MKIRLIAIGVLFIAFLSACDTTEPKKKISEDLALEVIDASCTESFLRIKNETPNKKKEIILTRNGEEALRFAALCSDTVVVDTGLTESTLYSYQVFEKQGEETTAKSEKTDCMTLAPTSHEFNWIFFYLGDNKSSSLSDVVIIDDDNIWAVGELFLDDSLGNKDYTPYNLTHWNGENWSYHRLQFFTFPNHPHTHPYATSSIFALDENDIWISSGNQITHFNGNKQVDTKFLPFNVRQIWGNNKKKIYAVGDNGGIACYDGQNWKDILSGVDYHFTDICGYGEDVCVCGVKDAMTKSILIRLTNNKIEKLCFGEESNSTIISPIGLFSTVWMDKKGFIFIGGNYVYTNKYNYWGYGNKTNDIQSRSYFSRIRGNSSIDMIAFGCFNTIMHYNGKDWLPLGNQYSSLSRKCWVGDIKEDMAVGVGVEHLGVLKKAIVIILNRI